MEASTDPSIRERLERFLARRTEAESVTIAHLTRVLGGAVHHIWAFDASFRGGSLPGSAQLILRIDAPGREQPEVMALEYALLKVMHEAGVPVPRPVFAGDESLGAPSFIMERVPGETNPRRLLREERYAAARERMPRQLGEILARIHQVPIDRLPLELLRGPAAGTPTAAYEIDWLEAQYREAALNPHPVFELAFRWLREQAPRRDRREQPLVLVHGDYRVGNIVYDTSGIRAILDWEGAHLGDPMEDLGWLCVRAWRFGTDHLPVGGLGTREDLAAGYEQGDLAVDWESWTLWEVLGNLRWGIATIIQAKTHLDGQTRSQELAAIGRRTAETEFEILRLIG
jgi:aminoglycoside phosphotransferase (APT) family kinase protein